MPARLLREGILDSEAVCSLDWGAEVFYRRLMSVVDDFGRFDGRPGVLRSRLYPLQTDKVREADISRWMAACQKAGLIALYSVAGKQYLTFHKLGSARAKESKWPPPPDGPEAQHADENRCAQMRADENGCVQVLSDAPGTRTSSGSGTSSDSGAGAMKTGPAPPAVVVLTFPTDGEPGEWGLTEAHVAEWEKLYPTLDVLAECRKALGWVLADPERRKTARGMKKFLVGWFGRGLERGGVRKRPAGLQPSPPPAETPLQRMQRLDAELKSQQQGADP